VASHIPLCNPKGRQVASARLHPTLGSQPMDCEKEQLKNTAY